MARDYYEVLGLSRSASEKEIRTAYRRLARQYHPDVNRDDPQAAERFKEVQRAYDVLGDEEKRAKYDRFGPDFDRIPNGAGGFGQGGAAGDFTVWGDLFSNLFGGAARPGGRQQWGDVFGGAAGDRTARPEPRAGRDVKVTVKVSLEEVDAGTKRDLSVTLEDVCSACGGSGYEAATRSCRHCSGQGVVRRKQNLPGLKIPAGVEHGQVIRVRDKGGKGSGGRFGDLLIEVQVIEHPFFTRVGNDLECELPISVYEAVSGAEVMVPTFRGKRPLSVPPGTQGGRKFRISGQGLPDRKTGTRGNLTVKVRLVAPTAATEEERRLLRQMCAREGDPRANLWRPPEV